MEEGLFCIELEGMAACSQERLNTYGALLAHWRNQGPKLLKTIHELFEALEESQSTSDVVAAIDKMLPDMRKACDEAEEVKIP